MTYEMREITRCVRDILNILNHTKEFERFFYYARTVYSRNRQQTDYDFSMEFSSKDTNLKFVWEVDTHKFFVGVINRRGLLATYTVGNIADLTRYIKENLVTYTEWMKVHSVNRINRIEQFFTTVTQTLIGYEPKQVDLETEPEGVLFDLNFNGQAGKDYVLIPKNSDGLRYAIAPTETVDRRGVLDFRTNTLFPRQLLFESYTEFKWDDELRLEVQKVLHQELRGLIDDINNIPLLKETLWLDKREPIISAGRKQLVSLLDDGSPVFYGFGMPYKTCEGLLHYYLYKELSSKLESVEDRLYLFKVMRTLLPSFFVMNA